MSGAKSGTDGSASNAAPGFHFVQSRLRRKIRSGTPTSVITILRVLRRGARLAKRARLSAFHRGSRQRDYSSQRPGVRPCFLGLSRSARSGTAAPTGGRRPHAAPRALPAPSCPSPASTSRAGHSAGRHDAQAARERSVSFRPRAPHSLRIGEYPRPKASVVERDSLVSNRNGDVSQERYHQLGDKLAVMEWNDNGLNCIWLGGHS